MTVVKICGLTSFDQACWALEAGADLLGFVLAPGRRQLTVEAAAEIVGRCREGFPRRELPWQAVGVFANQPLELVRRTAAEAGLDLLQLSGQEPPEYCRALDLPVFKALHLPLVDRASDARLSAPFGQPGPVPLSAAHLEEARQVYGAFRILLDSGTPGRWGGTGLAVAWETVGGAARDCLVAGGLDPENVATAITMMQPWGVDVSSGVERNGKKDRGLIQRFIRQAKGSNHHDDLG